MKRPAFQWYPGDFRRDAGIQACTFEARSLWREMLDFMHDGEPYGHLTAGGVPITIEDLARMVGVPLKKARAWLKELEDRKVFGRTEAGVLFSRRMVRDEHIRNVRAEAGKKGGNPKLLGEDGDKPPDKPLVNQSREQIPTPAVAPAVAVASPSIQPPAVAGFLSALPENQNALAWLSIIDGWHNGLGFEGGKAATPEDVATGLTEYLAGAKRDFSVIHVRSFVERARRNRLKSSARVEVTPETVKLWKLFDTYGLTSSTQFTLDTCLDRAKAEGAIADVAAFKRTLRKLNLAALRDTRTDEAAHRIIAEGLAGEAPEGMAA